IKRLADTGGGAPLFEALFVLENYPLDASLVRFADLEVKDLTARDGAHYPLALSVLPRRAGGLDLCLNFSRARIDPATAATLLARYRRLLESLVADVQQPIGLWRSGDVAEPDVSTLDESIVVAEEHATLPTWFEAQVRRTPQAPALECGSDRLTYAQLDGR